jgi:4-hydroxy-tetrahydrodipicolinate synthase
MSEPDLRALIVGPIATVPTAFKASYEVDYARMAAATEQWIANGLVRGRSVLKVAASIGEGQMLRESEWARLLTTVVEAAAGRVPVLGAIHHKDTVRTVEDAKRAADVGVVALQISPPIFNQPTQDDLLRYFGAVSDQIDLGIIVYATPVFRFGAIQPETFARMTDFERVVAIKWAPPDGVAYEAIFDLADRFNILDNDRQAVVCHRLGGHGFLMDGISAYPPYYLGVWDLLEARRYDEAEAEWERVTTPLWQLYRRAIARSGGDGKVEKGMSELMGLPMGPPRPPSVALTATEMTELRGLMAGWGWPVPTPDPSDSTTG